MNSLIVIGASCFLATLLSIVLRRKADLPPVPDASWSTSGLADRPWRTYKKWSKSLGPIFSMRRNTTLPTLLRPFGFLLPNASTTIVIDSLDILVELFQKRSEIFSDRPWWPMVQLLGRQDNVGFIPYGNKLREARKLLHAELNPQVVRKWEPLVEEITQKLMIDLKNAPKGDADHLRRTIRQSVESLMFRLTYGVEPSEDFLSQMAEASKQTGAGLQPGRWAVNSFPILTYVPEWAPGASFKKWARQAKERYVKIVRDPFDMVKADMKYGTAGPSFVSNRLGALKEKSSPASKKLIMTTAGSVFNAGTDSTCSIIETLFVLLSLHPSVQEHIYKEIFDTLSTISIPFDSANSSLPRLPEPRDMKYLEYTESTIKEAFRFNTPVPLLAHTPSISNIYSDWRIPKGAWILANLWSINHDEKTFKDPYGFQADRFLDHAVRDPTSYAFGLGRRACPGVSFAMMFLRLVVVRTVSLFEILPIEGPSKTNLKELHFTTGITSSPKVVNCVFKPRDSNWQ
ncbi:cytochrome P450 [Crucibulum laeve]|uniref:Cytochrome P450 n=1 Tax=Crucibulum laeve TaxID=68775 RepID=A0A5C3M0G8_9AGAR|nr:cytochrome P450 [Crucibulum laeve]